MNYLLPFQQKKKKQKNNSVCQGKVKWNFVLKMKKVFNYAYFNGIHCQKYKDSILLIQQDKWSGNTVEWWQLNGS